MTTETNVTSRSEGSWFDPKEIKIRVVGGLTRALVIESDCPKCGGASATDHGGGDPIPDEWDQTFWCETCEVEWGCRVQLTVTKI